MIPEAAACIVQPTVQVESASEPEVTITDMDVYGNESQRNNDGPRPEPVTKMSYWSVTDILD